MDSQKADHSLGISPGPTPGGHTIHVFLYHNTGDILGQNVALWSILNLLSLLDWLNPDSGECQAWEIACVPVCGTTDDG